MLGSADFFHLRLLRVSFDRLYYLPVFAVRERIVGRVRCGLRQLRTYGVDALRFSGARTAARQMHRGGNNLVLFFHRFENLVVIFLRHFIVLRDFELASGSDRET